MSIRVHRSDSRGRGDFGWLQARYSFSFSNYYHPQRMGFGLLRVLNDDIIAPGGGFGTHPHQDMEIITVPLAGALRHTDSTGGEGVLQPGEVQTMSAGSGIRHSEHNASADKALNLLQIWIETAQPGAAPAWNQRLFAESGRRDRLQVLASPDGAEDSLVIRQQAWISRALLAPGTSLELNSRVVGHGLFVFLISGELELDEEVLQARDAAEIEGVLNLTVRARVATDLLVINVPMK